MTDVMNMMKQMAGLKNKMDTLQTELDLLEIEGSAGGGMVRVTLSGRGKLKKVNLDPKILKTEEKEILEGLIVTASEEARTKMEALVQEKSQNIMSELTTTNDSPSSAGTKSPFAGIKSPFG